MKKILFPTEFSMHAGQTYLYALDLAKKNGASITLLHAYHVPINPKKSLNDMAVESLENLKEFANENTPSKYKGVEVYFITEMAAATDAILMVAEDEEIDLIVMGMKGSSSPIADYFGSITLDVVSRTNKPVFLVPSVNRFKPIEKIAYAFDLKLRDLLFLQVIEKLLRKLKAQVIGVHFEEEGMLKQSTQIIEMLKDLYQHHPRHKEISFYLGSGVFESGIQQFVVEENIDLLITHTYKRNWKFRFAEPSSSNNIARRINIPMLIIKEEALLAVSA